MSDKNFIKEVFGLWVRLYVGSTSDRRRLWKWKFNGVKGLNHGITLRLDKERCVGLQWRKQWTNS
jgi:hypothetical protein